jgi:hypothetical protein
MEHAGSLNFHSCRLRCANLSMPSFVIRRPQLHFPLFVTPKPVLFVQHAGIAQKHTHASPFQG